MFNFEGKKVLVAGGTGLIGTQLVELLLQEGARVWIVSLDNPERANPRAEFLALDLCNPFNCMMACDGIDYVFNLICVKGSPEAVTKYPAKFFDGNLLPDVQLLRAARMCGVKGFLFTSSLAVYAPAEMFIEDSVWDRENPYPSRNDWFAGWAKRICELQVEAYRKEFNNQHLSIVRPANTYGPYDDFWTEGAGVIPSLIRRVMQGTNPMVAFGDGSNIRDFIYARDVARGMLLVAKLGIEDPVNLGSGMGYSIKKILEVIIEKSGVAVEVQWDTSRPSGDKKRVLDTARACVLGFEPSVSLEEGIAETIAWFRAHKEKGLTRFNPFTKESR